MNIWVNHGIGKQEEGGSTKHEKHSAKSRAGQSGDLHRFIYSLSNYYVMVT